MMVVDVVREDLLPDPECKVLDAGALRLYFRQRLAQRNQLPSPAGNVRGLLQGSAHQV